MWKKKIFWLKTTIYLSLDLQNERPSHRRSQHVKTWPFLIFFFFFETFFPLLGPDPESGSNNLIESGSGSDPLDVITLFAVQFGPMLQSNEETGNKRPVMISLKERGEEEGEGEATSMDTEPTDQQKLEKTGQLGV